MNEVDIEARNRFFTEAAPKLGKAGFGPQPQEDGDDWNGSRLCRLTAKGYGTVVFSYGSLCT